MIYRSVFQLNTYVLPTYLEHIKQPNYFVEKVPTQIFFPATLVTFIQKSKYFNKLNYLMQMYTHCLGFVSSTLLVGSGVDLFK